MDIESRLAAYRRDGYTIFEAVYDAATMAAWRDECDRLEEAHVGVLTQPRSWWFGNMLERSPGLMWPAVSHPEIVTFAEQVMGPFVQLDNLTLAAFPPVARETADGRVTAWHRDRWAGFPTGAYRTPLSINAICYLQDLTDETGPLRVRVGSHIEPIAMTREEADKPHADEALIYMRAGDVIVTHNGLVHSGSPNVSAAKRYFFSVYYNSSWMKHTDTFDGPNCQQLIRWARGRRDHRSLRLLGVDDHLQQRGNSGFLQPDDARWRQWSAEDAAALDDSSTTTKGDR